MKVTIQYRTGYLMSDCKMTKTFVYDDVEKFSPNVDSSFFVLYFKGGDVKWLTRDDVEFIDISDREVQHDPESDV